MRLCLAEHALEALLAALVDKGLLKAGGKQRTDSTHEPTAVRDLDRLEAAGKSVRACLGALAVAEPDWLATAIDVPEWSARYGVRVDSWLLPGSQSERDALATAYGVGGLALLRAVYAADALERLADLPAVDVLRRGNAALAAWAATMGRPRSSPQRCSTFSARRRDRFASGSPITERVHNGS